MQYARRQMCLVTTISMLTVLLSSCGVSKSKQCNEMVNVINQGVVIGQEFAKKAKLEDEEKEAKSLIDMSSKVDQLAKKMQGIEIKDEKLQEIQEHFVKMYQNTSKNLYNNAISLLHKDEPARNYAVEAFKKGENQEDSLVHEVNNYCFSK